MNLLTFQRRLWRVTVYTNLGILALLFLMPVYMVIITSLKSPNDINLTTSWDWPNKIDTVRFKPLKDIGDAFGMEAKDDFTDTEVCCVPKSFSDAWGEFGPRLRNSFILVTGATVLSALLGSLNGYVLAKWRMPGSNLLFPLMLFGMFIPYQAILIPLFDFIRGFKEIMGDSIPGLKDSIGDDLISLILIHVVYGLPITTLIFRNFYVEIPNELLEAGAMDGAGFWKTYLYIIFPLSIPGFVVVVIWQFTQIWNEFLFAVTMTETNAQPITVGLAQLAGGEAVKWNLPMAGAILAALPTLVVYIVLGRYFIRGLLAGSIKG